MSCQTTHQLRRLTDGQTDSESQVAETATETLPVLQVHSGIFDWLICPPQSVISLLNNDIPDFSRESIRIHKDRPYWEDYDLYFWHNFTVIKNQIRQVSIDETFKKEMTRWSYLRTRFSELDPLNTVFVISNTQNNLATEVYDESDHDQFKFTFAAIEELQYSLARYFDTSVDSVHLEVVTRKNRSTGLQDRRRTTFLPVDQNEWKGSKQLWNSWWQELCATLAE